MLLLKATLIILIILLFSYLVYRRINKHRQQRSVVQHYLSFLLLCLLGCSIVIFASIKFNIPYLPSVLIFSLLFLLLDWSTLLQKNSEYQIHLEKIQIAKEHAEIEALKLQTDAHFLFNSLNTLSYLVSNDNGKSKRFIQKLADVYRYILVNKSKEFITLREELVFSNNYYFLLKERFGDSLNLQIENSDLATEDFLIIPISIQTLLENAIKHNALSSTSPLKINIDIDSETVTVCNNKRFKKADSLNFGLQNLSERFQLLTGKDIAVSDTPFSFSVTLPLKKINIL
jgi:LytS/YehU family sensor histidine kinase